MAQKTCKCSMGKNRYAKFSLDLYIKAKDQSVTLSIASGIYQMFHLITREKGRTCNLSTEFQMGMALSLNIRLLIVIKCHLTHFCNLIIPCVFLSRITSLSASFNAIIFLILTMHSLMKFVYLVV